MAAQINIKELVKLFVEDPNMIQNRYCFSQELGVLLADFKQFDDQYKFGVISAEELFNGILHKWISKQSENPTLRELLELLVGFKDLEEKLRAHFKLQVDSVLVSELTFKHEDGKSSPPSLIQHGLLPTVRNFSGRSQPYSQLQNCFEKNEGNLIAIVGPGGMGKSELARKFSNDFWKAKKANCVWLSGSSTKALISSLYELAKKLNISIQSSDKNLKIQEFAQTILDNIKGRLIVVLDNVDELTPVIDDFITTVSEGDGTFIIITSRIATILVDAGECIELQELSLEESKGIFFLSSTFKEDATDDEDLNVLCTNFDGFPLAFQQSISYIIQQRRGKSLKGAAYGIKHYLEEYEKLRRNF